MVIGRAVHCKHGAQEGRCPACQQEREYEDRIKALEDRLEALDGIAVDEPHDEIEPE